MSETCEDCGHPWHGLACTWIKTILDSEYRATEEECECPSAFKEK